MQSSELKTERVFGTLLEAVLSGRYEPGEALPRQRDLAADLGVTLGSLREALKRLEQMGLLDVRHGDATRVQDWRRSGGLDVVAALLFRGGTIDPDVLRDVLEARALTLRELGGLAARRRSPEQAARLEELAAAFAAAPDATAAAHVDFAYFTEVAEAAGNVVFVLLLNAIRGLYFGHLDELPVTAGPAELAPRYARLAEAIGRGDEEGARAEALGLALDQQGRVLP